MQRTSNPRVYACGDVAGPHEIVHVAILQGEAAARHATGRPADPVNYDSLLGVVFTDPQIGAVGLGEAQLKERGIDYLAADYPFDDHGKSITMEATDGYVRVFAAREDGRVLGAECVGKDGGELIHAMGVAVSLKATVHELLKAHWYHPTLSEIWTYPLEEIAEELAGEE
jgi:pyruvate/2-oxoglutarate dehydrogenase complex dihydrolipoamide dehydrogenase (E3) component